MYVNTFIGPFLGSVLGTSAAAVYTTPDANTTSYVKSFVLYNDSSTDAVEVEAWLVPTGDSPALAYKFLDIQLGPKETWPWDGHNLMLAPQSSIQFQASEASTVSCNGDVCEFQEAQ